ncbi:hypothetical protein [Carbonactinospora thermoautotrophica]|uniref:hypothetical protein n=1 Tax=Carbonactinospora thermoautotrophica TaxID=1469144 RepID=UPI00226E09FF|nr:hypothetical protein [Carbonactinospora thermoautotrophica]
MAVPDTASRAAVLTAGSVLLPVLLLAARTGEPGPPEPTQATAVPPLAPAAGAAANPRVLTCQRWGHPDPTPPGPDDLIVGPVRYPSLRRWQSMRPEDYGAGPDLGFYKVGTVVRAGAATVTVTVAAPARSYAALSHPATEEGDEAVTYQACPGTDTAFVGGFRLKGGRVRACVPLEIRVPGEAEPRQVTVSLFNGPCPQPSPSRSPSSSR